MLLWPSGLWQLVVRSVVIDVSNKLTASIFRLHSLAPNGRTKRPAQKLLILPSAVVAMP